MASFQNKQHDYQLRSLRDRIADLERQLEAANARVEAMRDVNRTLADEWWKGPAAQAVIAAKARLEIEMRMLEDILKGETDSFMMEYWLPIHDRAITVMRKLKQELNTPITHDKLGDDFG